MGRIRRIPSHTLPDIKLDNVTVSIPVDAQPGDTIRIFELNGIYYAMGDIHLTPRSLAKFGQLNLNRGTWNDIQLIPPEWVDKSFTVYSAFKYGRDILTNIQNLQYGYLWWSGTSGSHQIWYAWGHGGQMIVIIRDLDMVIVATASPQSTFDNYSWQKESSVMELIGRFIKKSDIK